MRILEIVLQAEGMAQFVGHRRKARTSPYRNKGTIFNSRPWR